MRFFKMTFMLFFISCASFYKDSNKVLPVQNKIKGIALSDDITFFDYKNKSITEWVNKYHKHRFLSYIPLNKDSPWILTSVKIISWDLHACGTGFYSAVALLTPLSLGLIPLKSTNILVADLKIYNRKSFQEITTRVDIQDGIGIGWYYYLKGKVDNNDWFVESEDPFRRKEFRKSSASMQMSKILDK